jgi:anaerobic selenocysteine-containing dehydrogenase
MKFEVTRRDVMRFAGGAAIGTALSPLPWTLTDDLAIWTQNWRWIPKPPTGERATQRVVCALCPAACALEAQCVGKSPVALRAAAGGHGICPLGLSGHHLPWHPARIDHPVRVGRGDTRPAKVTLADAVRETAAALSRARGGAGSVVVLDTRPDRCGSWAWRRLLGGIEGAKIVAAPGIEGSSLDTFDAPTGDGARRAALELSGACTILSFGAPIAEGWGRLRETCRGEITLMQVEPMRSRSAAIADQWLPARPGSEEALALGIANVLISERLVDMSALGAVDDFADYAAIAARYPLARVAATTGLPADDVAGVARLLAARGPSVVVAGEQPGSGPLPRSARVAILGLNLLLGNADRVVDRAELPAPRDGQPLAPVARLETLPDRSVALLVIDASAGDATFPWPLVERKLAKGSLVVALSPFLAGTARHADLAVPTAPWLETLHEIPAGFDETAPALSISAPLLPTREGAIDPVAFVRAVASAVRIDLDDDWTTTESLVRERIARIHAAASGTVSGPDDDVKPLAEFASPDELWDALAAGGRWTGERPASDPSRRYKLTAGLDRAAAESHSGTKASPTTLKVVARASRDTTMTAVVSPLLTKLYQESGLRRSPGSAAVNPKTAATLGLSRARAARLLTGAGSTRVALSIDEGVMPGVVELVVAPEAVALGHKPVPGARAAIDLLTTAADGSWSSVDAELVEG